MSEPVVHPDPASLIRVARLDGLIARGKVHQAYELLAELKDELPERFHDLPHAVRTLPDGPPEAA